MYEVKISHVHDPNVRFKSFPFCNKSKVGLVSTYVSKMSESIKFKTKKKVFGTNQHRAVKVDRGAH